MKVKEMALVAGLMDSSQGDYYSEMSEEEYIFSELYRSLKDMASTHQIKGRDLKRFKKLINFIAETAWDEASFEKSEASTSLKPF